MAVVIIIRMAVSVPIPMAEMAATVGGTEGVVMVEEVVDMDTTTIAGSMGNGVAVAAGMDMDQGTSSVVTSHPTLGLLLLLWLLWRQHLLRHHLLALLLHRHRRMVRLWASLIWHLMFTILLCPPQMAFQPFLLRLLRQPLQPC